MDDHGCCKSALAQENEKAKTQNVKSSPKTVPLAGQGSGSHRFQTVTFVENLVGNSDATMIGITVALACLGGFRLAPALVHCAEWRWARREWCDFYDGWVRVWRGSGWT
jgi:hypothetical protein